MPHASNQGAAARVDGAASCAEAFRRAVRATLGNAPDDIEPGRLHRFSTNGRPGDTAGWCRLYEDGRAGVFGDWRASISEVWTANDGRALTEPKRAQAARMRLMAQAERMRNQREQWAENRRTIEQVYANTQQVSAGDPVWRYLRRRGFGHMLEALPDCLRFHHALSYHHEDGHVTRHPAMVAPLVGQDGQITALHRTYLTRDGRKADVPSPKKLTRAAGHVSGATIPLFAPRRGQLGIAEGIETALGAHCASGVPVVASYSASTLAAWTWPAGLQHLVIFADNDPAGRKAAETLQARARRYRVRCDVLLPSIEGQDWADVWAESVVDRQDAWSAA